MAMQSLRFRTDLKEKAGGGPGRGVPGTVHIVACVIVGMAIIITVVAAADFGIIKQLSAFF